MYTDGKPVLLVELWVQEVPEQAEAVKRALTILARARLEVTTFGLPALVFEQE